MTGTSTACALQPAQQGRQTSVSAETENGGNVSAADEGRVTAPIPEGRVANRCPTGRRCLQERVQGANPHERNVHRQAEKGFGRFVQTGHPRLDRRIHAIGIPGIHDRPGGQPLDDRDRFGGPVTEDHVDAADPGGLKEADDPFKDRLSAERHQRLEVAHAFR